MANTVFNKRQVLVPSKKTESFPVMEANMKLRCNRIRETIIDRKAILKWFWETILLKLVI